MNAKLIEFFKKTMAFLKNNWIAIVVIGGLLLMSGTCSKIASNKIDGLNDEIARLNKINKDLEAKILQNQEAILLLDAQVTDLLKQVTDLLLKNKQIEKDKIAIAKKYADLKAKFGNLSQEDQDQLLLSLLKKYDITAEIRDNSLVITMTDRGKLYTFIISIDELKEQLTKSDEGWANCKITVQVQGAVIMNREEKIKLKDVDIANLRKIIINKDEIIKNYKSKVFWTKVLFFGKQTVPALVIGLVLGFMIGK